MTPMTTGVGYTEKVDDACIIMQNQVLFEKNINETKKDFNY